MMKLIAAIALILCHASSPSMSAHTVSIAENGSRPSQKGPAQAVLLDEASTVKINIRIADRVIPATLNGSKAAQDFASLLPLSLTLEDYASTEKISDLPKRLSTDGAPPGFDPSVGDITYYSPVGKPCDLLQRLRLLDRAGVAWHARIRCRHLLFQRFDASHF
jgi:hypothetical protein